LLKNYLIAPLIKFKKNSIKRKCLKWIELLEITTVYYFNCFEEKHISIGIIYFSDMEFF